MRLCTILAAASLAIPCLPVHADRTDYGPITIYSDSPLQEGTLYSDYNVLIFFMPGLESIGGPRTSQSSSTKAFTFDVNPGYTITDIRLSVSRDTPPYMPTVGEHPDFTSSGLPYPNVRVLMSAPLGSPLKVPGQGDSLIWSLGSSWCWYRHPPGRRRDSRLQHTKHRSTA